eukprot:m.260459 g.260459  ORF g.260459 m.260459 type:complete len:51 (+) comp39961_c0_seq1:419-571(+)
MDLSPKVGTLFERLHIVRTREDVVYVHFGNTSAKRAMQGGSPFIRVSVRV